jgi:two-component system, NarL family, sensor kinase
MSADLKNARPAAGESARELRILCAVAEVLNSAPDQQEALDRALELVADLLDLRSGWVWLLDRETGHFYNAAALNLPPYLQDPIRMTGAACWCTDSFLNGTLAPANVRLMGCSRLRPAVLANDVEATAGLSCHACIPLHFRDEPLGILNVTTPEWRQLTSRELRLLTAIGHQISTAVERARLAEESASLARAEERTRLAREIHDTLAQSLAAIALHLEGGMSHVQSDPELAGRRIERALALTRESLEEARRSVTTLRGESVPARPLAELLRSLARAFTADTGIRVRVTIPGGLAPLPPATEAELQRIAREALNNIARHARAHSVSLNLRALRGRVRLSVRDDGAGFDPASVPKGCHGIQGMRERATAVGGKLRLRSHAGAGTTVEVDIPSGETS